ncbi:mechanosensitive ion channel protein 6-like [Prunus yedoensis var. nudiflora]|uniref:Mechanosensitive ion channel protein 6-like n=1 Tax=Prunus yedoensis var. nudiflora TaxID=2094558 RepID=A0A314Z2I1_PRUYE|nr:mechanosensitive ion channel protein 6-like [Prunus yedoensis var. nudiflora]
MDFSIKKSFKSHGSAKHMRKISAGADDPSLEQLPILLDHDSRHRQPMSAFDSSDRREVIVKIDDGESSSSTTTTTRDAMAADPAKNGGKIWRESSIEFWNEDGGKNGQGFDLAQRRKTA